MPRILIRRTLVQAPLQNVSIECNHYYASVSILGLRRAGERPTCPDKAWMCQTPCAGIPIDVVIDCLHLEMIS